LGAKQGKIAQIAAKPMQFTVFCSIPNANGVSVPHDTATQQSREALQKVRFWTDIQKKGRRSGAPCQCHELTKNSSASEVARL
jgi:hypothetical protein